MTFENAASRPSANSKVILEAENLQKMYGTRKALKGLTFSLLAGRVLGFLGPNGAGKTTSIRILTTMMEPDSGQFRVDGVRSDQPQIIRRKIGVLPENLGLPRQMTAIEYLSYFGQLYGMGPKEARENAAFLLSEVGLDQRAKSLINSFSHGMRQRLGIARALVNSPVVVFLDEPTLGLDPRGQQELLQLILRIAREHNTGVVLCSHLLTEIEGICDDVIILSSGQVVAQGRVKDVVGGLQRNVARVRIPPDALEKAQSILKKLPSIYSVTMSPQMQDWLTIELEKADEEEKPNPFARNQLLTALIEANIPILSFEAAGGRLQDVFLQLTEEVIK